MLRTVTESVALLVVGAISAQVCTPSKEYYESIEKFSIPVFEQSQSLGIEFSEMMTKMETVLYCRLILKPNRNHHMPLKGKSRKINLEDLQEFCRNITNDETQSDDSEGRPIPMPDTPSHKVVENYRLIPLADLERITAVAVMKAMIQKIQKSDESKGEDLGTEAVIDVLDGIQDASQLVKSLSARFEKQQLRLQRVIDKGTAELLRPDDALYESRKRFLATAFGYGVFCLSMNKFWPNNTPIPIVRPPLYAAILMFPIIGVFHYTCSGLYLHNVHPFKSSRLIVAEDKSIYSTYFNPTSLIDSVTLNKGFTPKDSSPSSSGFLAGIYQFLGMREDDDDEDEEDEDKPAEIPLVWHGATLRDPFTLQRCSLHLIEKPIFDEILFRYVLLTRLVACGWGVLPAVVLSSYAYAAFVTGTCYDLRAMMCHLPRDDAFAMNFISGLSLGMMSVYGGILGAPLLNIGIAGYYMHTELSERGDIIKEKSEIWPVIKLFMKYDAAFSHASLKVMHVLKSLMPKNGKQNLKEKERERERDTSVSESKGKSKDVLAIEALAAAAIEAYGSKEGDRIEQTRGVGSQNKSGERDEVDSLLTGSKRDKDKERDKVRESPRNRVPSNSPKVPKEREIVMSPDDVYDFLEASLYAVTKIGRIQRLRDEKTSVDFLTVDYTPFFGKRQRHYSHVHALPEGSVGLRREDYLKPYVYMLYPKGMTQSQFVDFITCHLPFLNLHSDPKEIEMLMNEVVKWEKQAKALQFVDESGDEAAAAEGEEDADFLNLIDNVYKSVLYRLEVDAVLFGVWRSSAFLDDLAGRRTTPKDMKALRADLQEWMSYSYNRATADALVTYGLTPRRFARLLRLYEEKESARRTPEQGPGPTVTLRWQWEDYLTGKIFKKRISDIINPFG